MKPGKHPVHPPSRPVIREHHLRVERTARYAMLGEPGPAVRELWIACHGYGQLAARFLRPFEAVADPARVVAAPEALSRFYVDPPASVADAARRRVGATWMTREDREAEIADYVSYVERLHDLLRAECPAATVTAFGFSQGAATIARWVALGRVAVRHLVLWGGAPPPDLELERLRERLSDARVTIVAGAHDETVAASDLDSAGERLRAAGIACEVLRFAGGHVLDSGTLRRLAAPAHP